MSSVAQPRKSETRRSAAGYRSAQSFSPGGGVHFRVWAPKRRQVEVVFATQDVTMRTSLAPLTLDAEADGYFSGFSPAACAGDAIRLSDG